MPALILTLTAFALILVLGRLRVPLALAILGGALAAGFLFRLPPGDIARAILSGAVHPRSIGLLTITFLQLVLSSAMDVTGDMRRIVEQAKEFFRRPAVTLASLPALIGLLPMPGGALFSAPMVESAAAGQGAKGEWLSAVNYWFRHIWEHWWPLYPGVLLAMTLTNRSFGQFAPVQLPMGLIMAFAGLLLFRGAHAGWRRVGPPPSAGTGRRLAAATSPIWLIVLVWIPAAWVLNHAPLDGLSREASATLRRFGPIALGLAAGLSWTAVRGGLGLARAGRLSLRGSVASMLGLVLSVMVFQSVLERAEAAPKIAAELAQASVPPLLAVVILPFIAGVVTGLAFGFVGASFPIVIGVVQAMDPGRMAAFMALAYAAGHLGQMLSPIHLCYVVSNRYFGTGFRPVYRLILPPAGVTALGTALYIAALRLLPPL
jgi:hypothetical protein